jgi:hypothetical protein
MRLGRGVRATFETSAGEPERLAAWDGFHGSGGPTVVIRADRAGEAAEHPESRQVA